MSISKYLPPALLSLPVLTVLAGAALAAEGGTGAYLPGSRDSMAGFAPPPGSYFSMDVVHLDSQAPFLPISGVVLDEVTSSATVTKLNFTYSFADPVLGGQPYITLTAPYVNGSMSFAGELINGFSGGYTDVKSGMGDLTLTPAIGYHSGNNHWVYAASIFAPTGYYAPASFDVPARTADVLSFSKNRWAVAPTVSFTNFDMKTGLEFSASGSLTVSQMNPATQYQTAPEAVIEYAAMQHLKSGLALGLTGYIYQQTADDTGAGADAMRAVTNASSLQAGMQGVGPIVTYNTRVGGTSVSMKLKYIHEYYSVRRFQSDVVAANIGISF